MTYELIEKIKPYAAATLMLAGLSLAGIRAYNIETRTQDQQLPHYTQQTAQSNATLQDRIRFHEMLKQAEQPSGLIPSVYTHTAENLKEINNRKVR